MLLAKNFTEVLIPQQHFQSKFIRVARYQEYIQAKKEVVYRAPSFTGCMKCHGSQSAFSMF